MTGRMTLHFDPSPSTHTNAPHPAEHLEAILRRAERAGIPAGRVLLALGLRTETRVPSRPDALSGATSPAGDQRP